MVRELLTRKDFYDAILSGEGRRRDRRRAGRTAHPVSCPTLEASHFVEKVNVNERRNGRYYWAASFSEAHRDLDADPCHRS
jgi:hypothetical protein